MATFNTYQQPAGETPIARKWFVLALIASLLIHLVLLVTFRATRLEHFAPYTERLVPRAFTSLGRVEVDEKLLSDEPEKKMEEEQQKSQAVPNIDIPQEKPTVDANPQDTVYKPSAPEAVKPIATENPKVAEADLKTLTKMQQSVSSDLDNELNAMSEQLIKDKTKTSTKSLLKYSETKGGGPGSVTGAQSAIPGMKSLDDALSSTGGGLQNGDKIGIRGGALFEYDKADLRTEALGSLQQLGTLVKRYPNATLQIEGYADSIGDPSYNLDLSQRRADAVKTFLTQTMGINGARIQAVGKGSTKFIDPPTYDYTKQALEQNNRRVEIVFKFPR